MGIGAALVLGVAASLPGPFDDLEANVARSFRGWNLALYGGAVASTGALSGTGGDHALRVEVQERLRWKAGGDGAVTAGYVLPVLIPAALYATGLVADERSFAGAGSAALQALTVTLLTTVLLKVGTGRPFPLHDGDPSAADRLEHPEYAREWQPFSFQGRYAWPSGHTAAAFSVAASLSAYSDSLAVPLVSYPVALGIGAGMLVGDHHWASDVLAGALLGQGIGWSVGEGFRERAHATSGMATWVLVPLTGQVRGAAVSGVW